MVRVLFVCTGNICRSPTAEGVFRNLVLEAGLRDDFHVESAGTESYHAGEPPDARAIAMAQRNGVAIGHQRARPLAEKDFHDFDHIYAMDSGHMREMQARAPKKYRARLDMFLPGGGEVPDPWYGNEKHFREAFDLINVGAKSLLRQLREEHGI